MGLPCEVTSRDGILQIDGGQSPKAILVNGADSFVLSTGGRHPRGPISLDLLKESSAPGASLHIEFCGASFVRMVSDGREVFKLTQGGVESNVRMGMQKTGFLAVLGLLVGISGRCIARREVA